METVEYLWISLKADIAKITCPDSGRQWWSIVALVGQKHWNKAGSLAFLNLSSSQVPQLGRLEPLPGIYETMNFFWRTEALSQLALTETETWLAQLWQGLGASSTPQLWVSCSVGWVSAGSKSAEDLGRGAGVMMREAEEQRQNSIRNNLFLLEFVCIH